MWSCRSEILQRIEITVFDDDRQSAKTRFCALTPLLPTPDQSWGLPKEVIEEPRPSIKICLWRRLQI